MAKSRALINVLNAVNKEELSVERQFLNDLNASIEMTDKKNMRQPSKTYKPSSMHCIRNMFYQASGVEAKSSSSSALIGICESGSDRHEHIQQAVLDMASNGMDCEYVNVADYVRSHDLDDVQIIKSPDFENGVYETKLYNNRLNISFLCDGIIRYKGKYYILEIKTETNNKFWNREDVNPDHILQGTAYSLNLGIDEVLFLYESRDNCGKKTFMLHVTQEMRNALEEKILNAIEYVNNGVVPPKPTDVSRKACTYCNYAERCKRDGN